jgi:potassium efflux system protein
MYALLVVIFLIGLRIVGIPLTAFAVAGGALAIGVGFGSQNVVNNFISGVILLAERPIKIGDLVQVDETYGNVERIGLRSTRVRTGENIHVIVPNSAFLETKVINWTHNDPTVRVRISVGVAYGSPTREVERLIVQALADHKRVLDTPAPVVLFSEFGDNALQFDAHFWLRVRHQMDRMRVESEIRYRIDDLFREAEIVIAFPQRDVHVDTLRPLDVRLLRAEGPEAP